MKNIGIDKKYTIREDEAKWKNAKQETYII